MQQILFPYYEIRKLLQELLALHLHLTIFFRYASAHPYFCKIDMEIFYIFYVFINLLIHSHFVKDFNDFFFDTSSYTIHSIWIFLSINHILVFSPAKISCSKFKESLIKCTWNKSPKNITSIFQKEANEVCLILHKYLSTWYNNVEPIKYASSVNITQSCLLCFFNVSNLSPLSERYSSFLNGKWN